MKLLSKIDFPEITVNAMIHIFILFTLLSIFFFTVVSRLAKQKIQDEIYSQINGGISNNYNKLSPISKEQIYLSTKNINSQKIQKIFDKPDPLLTFSNKTFFIIAISICIFLFTIICVTVWVMKMYKSNIDMKSILLENSLTFLIIGGIEVVFFMLIALQYSPIYPSQITKSVIDSLNKCFSSR
jgi:hypothetical protein